MIYVDRDQLLSNVSKNNVETSLEIEYILVMKVKQLYLDMAVAGHKLQLKKWVKTERYIECDK